jgi:hypothetical protein
MKKEEIVETITRTWRPLSNSNGILQESFVIKNSKTKLALSVKR